ncbi:ribosome-associated translation inhibitor RaiA [Patescibacteria group bacterium]|uniref:Ribosome-associated translation inhibitor RaiA n=1 Tax=candidate division WWE3 bacterium TaxID=2053526 RepID=A0A928Y6Y9_UNCKA|nr:ribosome-associated translation inhibitor RaiA [candidate division WWE3 bacterium]MCL4732467.1 ribosome-associated translation inhibitor RaiA [Patescibacteria group bacterium]
MYINIQPKSMELTDAVKSYCEEKFHMLEKYYDHIEEINCELGMTSRKHNKGSIYTCTGHLFVPGKDFYVEKQEEDLYKAIDKVKDHLQEMLVDWKEKKRG